MIKISFGLAYMFDYNKLDYYYQKPNVRVASRVAERFKTYNLRKLENFKKISEMLATQNKNLNYCARKLENISC